MDASVLRASVSPGAPLFSRWAFGSPICPKERVVLRQREGGPPSQCQSVSHRAPQQLYFTVKDCREFCRCRIFTFKGVLFRF